MGSFQTISRRIWTLSGFFSLLVAIIGTVGVWNAVRLGREVSLLANVHMIASRNAATLDMYHDGIRSHVYRALEYSSEKNSAGLAENRTEAEETFAEAEKIYRSISAMDLSDKVQLDLKSAEKPLENYIATAKGILSATAGAERERAVKMLTEFDASFKNLEKELEGLSDDIESEGKALATQATADAESANWMSIATLIIGLVLGFGVARWIAVDISTRLNTISRSLTDGAGKLGEFSEHINKASGVLAEATTEQSSAIEETVSSMEEMSSMIAQTAQNAATTLDEANESKHGAEEGREVVAKMVVSVREIAMANERLQGIVNVIENIKNKTKVINDIAFETRLLAFNASIEAARAGAHGRGFAVVAEEVGKLANVSGKAADEVRELLDGSVADVTQIVNDTKRKADEGEKSSKLCEAAFARMEDSIGKISQAIQRIAAASKEQEIGVGQTNKAMIELEKVTQSNSRSAERLASQSSDLRQAAGDLKDSAFELERIVLGTSGNKTNSSSTGNGGSRGSSSPLSGSSPSIQSPGRHGVVKAFPSADATSDGSDVVDRSDSRWHAA